jgi:hypothetical protein
VLGIMPPLELVTRAREDMMVDDFGSSACNGIVALWCAWSVARGMFVSSEEMECTSV